MTIKLPLPAILIHCGHTYRLSQTNRDGLILEKCEQQELMDPPLGEVVILAPHRATLRSQRATVAQPRRTS